MARKRHTAEEIVSKLRQVDMLTAQGRSVAEAVRAIGVTEVSYRDGWQRCCQPRWRGLLLAGGSQGRDRELATARQHQPPALGPGLQATGSRSGPMDGSTNHPDRGSKADHALTSNLDHLMGAGQSARLISLGEVQPCSVT
jgi:hypothetical protein